jgi:hypothetical protein
MSHPACFCRPEKKRNNNFTNTVNECQVTHNGFLPPPSRLLSTKDGSFIFDGGKLASKILPE